MATNQAGSTLHSRGLLVTELGFFIRLRWAAGAALVLCAVALRLGLVTLPWQENGRWLGALGGGILGYNVLLWGTLGVLRRRKVRKPSLLVLAWVQLLLDLACLTVLTLLTGGVNSPLRGFFVFHMVFASLLLPRHMAYASAGLAMLMLAMGLWVTEQWPVVARESASMLAWVTMLLVTVWLTNGITRGLREQGRRLRRQNRRIRGMTRALRDQQKAMIQQEKMATAGRMAAGVAHEIANPLASMDGLLQLMERRPEKARPEAVGTLREQVTRISQIVRRMTAFAHPGDGEWHVANLNEVVEKAISVLRFDPRAKAAKVEVRLAPELPSIRMLPEAMQQVVINLVVNALDAMEDVTEPRLEVRTYDRAGWCVLEVSDNGHGITPGNRRKLFEPFFTTKPVGKGTGLGLSITYNLVETHQGEIEVDSEGAGKGARFTVRLPAAGGVAGDGVS